MAALFDDPPGIYHEDLVGMLDGGEAVGGDEGSAPGH
jgi:hypothetical protein